MTKTQNIGNHTAPSGGKGVYISKLTLKYQSNLIFDDLNWTIQKGEQWVLSGISGSGKTTLANALTGKISYAGNILIAFDNTSSLPQKVLFVESWYQFTNVEGVANFYYQQRYTAKQAKETLTVKAELQHYAKENNLAYADAEPILKALSLENLQNSQLIELSSGEHKKLQLVKALWLKPQFLIVDQPYTGLDAASRKNLNILLNQVCTAGLQLILITNEDELPACINRFAELKDGKISELNQAKLYLKTEEIDLGAVPDFLTKSPVYSSNCIAKMVDVNISYGEKKVLKNINWEVMAGERWLLQGPNGSGKSTLLSLINGDHPQSYANELYLFGKKRGTGESIWDIKKHIGLISPEFHWYFDSSTTVWQSVASGLYDSVGLYKTLPYSKAIQVDQLLQFFNLSEYKNSLLNTLPLGKQRLVLLARTIIKNPELLVLDEPCQGLDQQQTAYFNQLIDALCGNGMTVIYGGHYESHLPKCLNKKLVLKNGEVELIEDIRNKKVHQHLELID